MQILSVDVAQYKLKILKVLRFDTKSSTERYFLDTFYANTIFTGPWNLHNVTRPRLKSESLVFTLPPQFTFYENRIVVDSEAYFVNSKQLPGFYDMKIKSWLKLIKNYSKLT